MKLLVATGQTQGMRTNDYNGCVEGELVFIGMACADDERNPDGECGCGRGFSGLSSSRASTTARVAELPGFTKAEYVEALRSGLGAAGYESELAPEIAESLLDLIRFWPVGTVVERRLDEIRPRSVFARSRPPD
ncbi:hypothetical protein [Amycolatopsis sp. NPDC059657]|uniref:DUF7715 family protein n=1 Tax=Amycolatopsis sp. NPDC059657 TaxID=3346899 RepID=UPI0036734FA4